jgi:DNA-binding NarL/FixJ family response regulator
MRTRENQLTKKLSRRLLLVDDHPIMREGFARVINHEPDLKVCGQSDNAAKALEDIAVLKPDLVIVDIALKGVNGIDLVKRIAALHPETPVLVLSVQDEALFAERALRAGARGYVMKQASTEEVMGAIRQVLRGSRYLSRRMQDRMLENISEGNSAGSTPGIECLSDRELEVFQLVGSGCGTRQIAEQLRLSIKTIETYRAHIKQKLKLRNGMELIRSAIKIASDQQNRF